MIQRLFILVAYILAKWLVAAIPMERALTSPADVHFDQATSSRVQQIPLHQNQRDLRSNSHIRPNLDRPWTYRPRLLQEIDQYYLPELAFQKFMINSFLQGALLNPVEVRRIVDSIYTEAHYQEAADKIPTLKIMRGWVNGLTYKRYREAFYEAWDSFAYGALYHNIRQIVTKEEDLKAYWKRHLAIKRPKRIRIKVNFGLFERFLSSEWDRILHLADEHDFDLEDDPNGFTLMQDVEREFISQATAAVDPLAFRYANQDLEIFRPSEALPRGALGHGLHIFSTRPHP